MAAMYSLPLFFDKTFKILLGGLLSAQTQHTMIPRSCTWTLPTMASLGMVPIRVFLGTMLSKDATGFRAMAYLPSSVYCDQFIINVETFHTLQKIDHQEKVQTFVEPRNSRVQMTMGGPSLSFIVSKPAMSFKNATMQLCSCAVNIRL